MFILCHLFFYCFFYMLSWVGQLIIYWCILKNFPLIISLLIDCCFVSRYQTKSNEYTYDSISLRAVNSQSQSQFTFFYIVSCQVKRQKFRGKLSTRWTTSIVEVQLSIDFAFSYQWIDLLCRFFLKLYIYTVFDFATFFLSQLHQDISNLKGNASSHINRYMYIVFGSVFCFPHEPISYLSIYRISFYRITFINILPCRFW